MKVFEVWSMVGSESGGMEATGFAVFADGQALVLAEKRNPRMLVVDYEFTTLEDAAARLLPQVMSFRETRDAVRSFTELYALAANRYGWDPDADRLWKEIEAQSEYAEKRTSRPLKKPKGFVRAEGAKGD